MNDWRDDDLDRHLSPGVDPMNVPEGAFKAIRKEARRRRWARASSTVAAVAVFSGGVVSGGMVLTGSGDNGGVAVPSPPLSSSPLSPSPNVSSSAGQPGTVTSPPDPTASATETAGPSPEESAAPEPTPDTSETGDETGGTDGGGDPAMSPTPSEDVAVCDSGDMTASSNVDGAAAGSVYWDVVFTNESAVSCSLSGYPDVVLEDADLQPLRTETSTMPPEPTYVVLAGGESASVTIRADNQGGTADEECQPPAEYARVTPGNGWIRVPFESQACHHRIAVSGMTPGSEGAN